MKLLAPLLFVAFPAAAQLVIQPFPVDCAEKDGKSYCILPEAQLDHLLDHNNNATRDLARAIERIKELEAKKPPKCAETEVTEPSKNPAPKPIPYIKPERDT